jgi:hypothetical protein
MSGVPTSASSLRGIKSLFAALSATIAVLSPTLFPDRLIPQQLSIVGSFGTLLILAGLLISLIYWPRLPKLRLACLTISVITLCLLIFLQLSYVITVEKYGNPPATHHFLIGYRLTNYGISLRSGLSQEPLPEADYIREIGYDEIPAMYGKSYQVLVMVYSLTYLLFVFGIILTIAGLLSHTFQQPRRRKKP